MDLEGRRDRALPKGRGRKETEPSRGGDEIHIITNRRGQTDAFPIRLQNTFCVRIEPSVPFALASHELRPLLLAVNYGEALEPHSRFVRDHLVESPFDFAAIRHSVSRASRYSPRQLTQF